MRGGEGREGEGRGGEKGREAGGTEAGREVRRDKWTEGGIYEKWERERK